VRIATLLDAREQEAAAPEQDKNVRSHDFASRHNKEHSNDDGEEAPRKKRKLKHKVVIHSSPFLRCLQTSVAIAAGMAQYKPSIETTGLIRKTSKSHTGSPRLKPMEGHASPRLAAIAEPDLAHALARKALQRPKHYRKSKLRVDAFLGEWLNPEYYDKILPPPPSAMMMTTAKAELMENETVEIFTPTISQKSSNGNLWSGSSASTSVNVSKESTLDDWSPVEEAMPTSPVSPTARRRASQSSVGSIDRPKSPFRPGSALQLLTSTLPKQETSIYHHPQPQYALSTADGIPRGYVAHARNACTNVDYQWDSSRPPQNWGDGGEFGEEWSAMHKRFRRGLNHLVHWYSQHDAEDRGEDALGLDQAERRPKSRPTDDDEQEDTVVIMVTHGAGCNALIGALTGQPVLLDVGMASLTMAVRKHDAPNITTSASSSPEQGYNRRGSLDLGLNIHYDLKLVASTEHLRPSAQSPSMRPTDANRQAFMDTYHQRLSTAFEPARSNTHSAHSALGSMRRPSAISTLPLVPGLQDRSVSSPPGARLDVPPMSAGLWTPPGAQTPASQPYSDWLDDQTPPTDDLVDSTQLSRPGSSDGDVITELPVLPSPGDAVPMSLSRGLSQKGLWGAQPKGVRVERKGREAPKRRWSVDQE